MNEKQAEGLKKAMPYMAVALAVLAVIISIMGIQMRSVQEEGATNTEWIVERFEITEGYLTENPIMNRGAINKNIFLAWLAGQDEDTYKSLTESDVNMAVCVIDELVNRAGKLKIDVRYDSFIFTLNTGNQVRYNRDGTVKCYIESSEETGLVSYRGIQCDNEEICLFRGAIGAPIATSGS